jgi:hypothetical protein
VKNYSFPSLSAALLALFLGMTAQACLAGGAIEIITAEFGKFPATSVSLDTESKGLSIGSISGGGGAGRSSGSGTLDVVRSVDGTTSKLYTAMVTGKFLKTVTVSQPGLTLVLQNVQITAMTITSNDETGEVAEENLTLNFQQASVTATDSSSTGRGKASSGAR